MIQEWPHVCEISRRPNHQWSCTDSCQDDAWCTKTLLSWKDAPELSTWTRDDVEYCIRKMIGCDWSTTTNNTFLINLMRLVSYAKQGKIISLKNDGDFYSPEVSWIHPTRYGNRKKEKEIGSEDLISKAEKLLVSKDIDPKIACDFIKQKGEAARHMS